MFTLFEAFSYMGLPREVAAKDNAEMGVLRDFDNFIIGIKQVV